MLGGRDKMVRAIDVATGKPRWSFATRARVDSSPAIAGDRVVVGSATARSTCSISRPARRSGSSKPAPASPRPRDRRRPHRHRRHRRPRVRDRTVSRPLRGRNFELRTSNSNFGKRGSRSRTSKQVVGSGRLRGLSYTEGDDSPRSPDRRRPARAVPRVAVRGPDVERATRESRAAAPLAFRRRTRRGARRPAPPGTSIFRGRKAVAIWVLAALLHGPAVARRIDRLGEPALPEFVVTLTQLAAVSSLVLTLAWAFGRVSRRRIAAPTPVQIPVALPRAGGCRSRAAFVRFTTSSSSDRCR